MGIRLKEGRFFNSSDGIGGRDQDSTIIVNETFAKATWPGAASAVGKRVSRRHSTRRLASRSAGSPSSASRKTSSITASNGRCGPACTCRNRVSTQSAEHGRAEDRRRPGGDRHRVRAGLREVDPEIPAYDMRTMDERLALIAIAARRVFVDARRVCGDGAVARARRQLWRDVVSGVAAHARARHPRRTRAPTAVIFRAPS